MNVKNHSTTVYIGLAIVLSLCLLLIPFPQHDRLTGLVTPLMEYQLTTDGNGSFTSTLKDLWRNQLLESRIIAADREGVFGYQLNPDVPAQGMVKAGDTLAWISSSKLESELISLDGNIRTLRASLEFERSGSRETVIEGARQRLNYARIRHEEQKKVLQRSADLFKQNFISQQEYDQDLSRERLDAIRISIAEADLGSALAGAPSTKLNVIRTQIAEEERKLRLQESLMSLMTVTSPLSGKVFFPLSEDTLISVGQMDTVVVMIPVHGGGHDQQEMTETISLKGNGWEHEVMAPQVRFDDHIVSSGSAQLLLVRVRLDNTLLGLVQGQRIEASFKQSSKSVLRMLMEIF